MTKVPTPPSPGSRPSRAEVKRPEDVVLDGVVAALGVPPDLFRVDVLPLWKDRYRVNLLTGPDAASVTIPHSYFVVATPGGAIVSATPPVVRTYS